MMLPRQAGRVMEEEMLIYQTGEAIEEALREANECFDNNLTFGNFTRLSDTRYRVSLRVKNSYGKGARLSITKKHIPYACWHAYGVFMNSLPEGTKIVTGRGTLIVPFEWKDWNIGSLSEPFYYSQACECRKSFVAPFKYDEY